MYYIPRPRHEIRPYDLRIENKNRIYSFLFVRCLDVDEIDDVSGHVAPTPLFNSRIFRPHPFWL